LRRIAQYNTFITLWQFVSLKMMPLKINQSIGSSSEKATAEEPKKLKPCCACPETKRVRDAW